MTRVAIVSTVMPKPVDNGKRVVLSGLLDYFCERVGAGNVHYVVVGPPSETKLGVPTHFIDRPGAVEKIANLAVRTVGQRTSLQESMVFGRHTAVELKALLDALDVDLEILDTLRIAQFIPRLSPHSNRVVYLDDLFSRRYTEMARTNRAYPGAVINPLGEFAPNVPGVAARLLSSRLILGGVLRTEAALIGGREKSLAQVAPALLINDTETEMLNKRAQVTSVRTMPPLLDPPPAAARRLPQIPTFVFLGLLSIPHNDAAVRIFLQEQWANVQRRIPGAQLRIIGRAPSAKLSQLVAAHADTVTLEGFVEDLGDSLAGATAMISPLKFGTGIKLKLIEALSRGLPIVSTRFGTEGIADRAGQGALISDDLSEYPELLASLCDPSRNATVGREGLEHYGRTFAPDVVKARYDEVFALQPLMSPAY